MSNPAYPKLAISARDSKRIVRDGRQEDTTGDGITRVRKLHADRVDFDVVHPGLNSADAAVLEAFYASYGTTAAIDFTWTEDGQTYTVRFGRDGFQRTYVAPGVRTYRVKLVAAA